MKPEYALTALFLALAGFIALADGLPSVLSWEMIAVGIFTGLIASFIDSYRTKVLIEEGAKSTVEYMSVQQPITIRYGIGSQMVEQMMHGFQQQMTKAMGKSLLAFENVIELAVKMIGALCALLLFFVDPTFVLGLWIILSTIAVTALMKISGVFSFAFGLVSNSIVPLSSYTDKSKQLITAITAASCASWLLFAMQWWLGLNAFGSSESVLTVFFLYALITTLALLPYTIEGIGAMELVAVLLFPFLGISAAHAFIAIVIWQITRLVGNSASVWVLQRRQDLSQFR